MTKQPAKAAPGIYWRLEFDNYGEHLVQVGLDMRMVLRTRVKLTPFEHGVRGGLVASATIPPLVVDSETDKVLVMMDPKHREKADAAAIGNVVLNAIAQGVIGMGTP